jgi:centractin
MEHGHVTSWSDLEALWTALYDTAHGGLGTRPSEHPVLLTEAPHTPKAQRERAAQVFFESLHVPALYIGPTSPLALYSSGRVTGVVLECGEGVTAATPIYEGYAVPHAVCRAEYGGGDITRQLGLLLRKSGVALHTTSEAEAVRAMKETACYVSPNPAADEAAVQEGRYGPVDYRLPDGSRISLGAERFRATEALFRPSLLGLEYRGAAELVSMAVARSDMDLRATLLRSVLLAGGSTMTRGFGARMMSELRRLSGPETRITVWAPHDRQALTWVGGSILASLSTFKSLWITKDTWEEEGPAAIHRAAL